MSNSLNARGGSSRRSMVHTIAWADRSRTCTGACSARDATDRSYAEPLSVRAVAAAVHILPAHFGRCFVTVFGETPHRYLQRRWWSRSMLLLREIVVDDGQAPSYTVIADPDGNKACVCTTPPTQQRR